MPDKLLVVGAGGHGKVVIDALRSVKTTRTIVVADEDTRKSGQVLLGLPVMAPLDAAIGGASIFHVAIGNNTIRERLSARLIAAGLAGVTIPHPRASIADSVRLGDGAFIAAMAVIGPDAAVDAGCIINHGAIVDHDCRINAFAHIAPGATLGGGVRVGTRVLIGAGANVLPGVSIGDDCVVGAGAVVLNDLEPGSMYVGVPARKFR